MKHRRLLLIVAAIASIAIATTVLLLANRNNIQEKNDMMSSNLALLGRDEVPDHELSTKDSLLRFEFYVADLGRMKIGQKQEVGFRFRNVSQNPVVITKILTTCGCTSPEWEKRPLMPDKESVIKVTYEAEEEGVFFKKLFVYYAGGTTPLEIAIKGEVR